MHIIIFASIYSILAEFILEDGFPSETENSSDRFPSDMATSKTALINIFSSKLKRKAADEFIIQHLWSKGICNKKVRISVIENDGQIEKLSAAVLCCFPKERKSKGPIEERSSQWWDDGYCKFAIGPTVSLRRD